MSHEEFAPFVCLVGCFVVIIFYYKPEQISSSFFNFWTFLNLCTVCSRIVHRFAETQEIPTLDKRYFPAYNIIEFLFLSPF